MNAVKKFLTENPRKTLVLGIYLMVFIVFSFFQGVSTFVLIMDYLIVTLILIAIFHVDCISVVGNFYYGRGNPEKAAKFLQYAITHNTKSPAAHLHYAIYLMRRGGANEARPLLDKAMGLNPKAMMQKNLQLTKGSCLWLTGELDEAIAHLERMRREYDYVNPQVMTTLAYLYLLRGDLQTAEQLTKAALDDDPATAAAWDNLGQIRYKQKDLTRAKESFTKALEHKSDIPDSLYYLGLIARQEGEMTQAEDYFTRAAACTITPLNTVTRPQIEEALTSCKKPVSV